MRSHQDALEQSVAPHSDPTLEASSVHEEKHTFSILSDCKSKFLQESLPNESLYLNGKNLKRITAYYERKYNIRIIVNGHSQFGRPFLQTNQEKVKKIVSEFRAFPYANYLKKFWVGAGVRSDNPRDITVFTPQYHKIANVIKKFLGEEKELKRYLSKDDLNELNQICSEDDSCRAILNPYIIDYVNYIKNWTWLTSEQCEQEIQHIVNHLGPDEVVGYLFTNGSRMKTERAHVEGFILMQARVIKPIEWDYEFARHIGVIFDLDRERVHRNILTTLRIPDMYFLNLSNAVRFLPQADSFSCGTVSMLFLKELLKNDAEQLKDEALIFSYYEKSTKPPFKNLRRNSFIPSPQVLRYSQVSYYNKMLKKVICSDDPFVEFPYKDKTYQITTLQHRLQQSIELASQENDLTVVETNRATLANLSLFRRNWKRGFEQSQAKRDQMAKEGHNQYLTYKTVSLGKIAQ